MNKVYVIMPIFNRKEATLKCLNCLFNQDYKNYEVIIFDDNSTDGSKEEIQKRFPRTIILSGPGDFWWTKSVNTALAYVLSRAGWDDYVLTLNNDTYFDKNYISELVKAANDNPGACLGTLYTEDKKIYEGPVTMNWQTFTYFIQKYRQNQLKQLPTALSGASTMSCRGTMIPVKIFHEIGFFDEKSLPHYGADYDFFFRAKKSGYDLLVSSKAITYDLNVNTRPPKRKSIRGLISTLFDYKSPFNIKTQLVIVWRYCPNLFLKILNSLRIILGTPISYLFKS